MPPQVILDLKIWGTHFHERFGVITAGDHTTIVVAQHHNRHLGQVRSKHSLTAGIKRIRVDQREYRVRLNGHGCAR